MRTARAAQLDPLLQLLLSLSLSLSGARFGRWRQGTAAKFGVRCRRKGEQFRFRVRRQGDASLLQKPAHRATRRFTRQSGALRHDARRAKQIMVCVDMGCTRRPTPALILTTLVGWSRHKRPRAGHAGALLAIICLSVIVVRPVACLPPRRWRSLAQTLAPPSPLPPSRHRWHCDRNLRSPSSPAPPIG